MKKIMKIIKILKMKKKKRKKVIIEEKLLKEKIL